MEHLLSVWPQINRQLEAARHIYLFADCDGTLAPIVPKPNLAVIPLKTRKLLKQLSRESKITLSVISGRAIADLRNLVRINGIIYAGNHGMEIAGPGIKYLYPVSHETLQLFPEVLKTLDKALSGIPGVIIENKGLTLSVHYRMVARNRVAEVKDIFHRSVNELNAADRMKITTGKEVLEVRPAVNWHKGKAVQLLMKRDRNYGKPGALLPVYLGDDSTDEDAFRQTQRYNRGMAVFVGEKRQTSKAKYYLNSTVEVALFLERLLETMRR